MLQHLSRTLCREIFTDKTEKIEAPPDNLSADDLATTLLYHMQVGRNQGNMLAAAEALRIKSSQKHWTIAKAYIHIAQRWFEYKSSEHYRSKFRRGAAGFLNEGDYDNPALWGGTNVIPDVPGLDPVVAEMRALKRDRELHPENYVTQKEVAELFERVVTLKTKKRMPAKKSDILPMVINPDRHRQKLTEQAELLRQRDAMNCSTVGSKHTFSEIKNNGLEQKKLLVAPDESI